MILPFNNFLDIKYQWDRSFLKLKLLLITDSPTKSPMFEF